MSGYGILLVGRREMMEEVSGYVPGRGKWEDKEEGKDSGKKLGAEANC